MKRICIISPGLNDGGAERVASILANYFASKNYEVLFIAIYSQDREYYISDKIKYVYINSCKNRFIKFLDRNIKILKEIKKHKTEIIISFSTKELFLANIFYPIIFTLRNDPERDTKSKAEDILRNIIYQKSKHVVFQTEGAKKYFNKKIQNKSTIIYNPVETKKMSYWNSENNSKTFIAACRLNPQKNLKLMINAFAKFHEEYNDYKLEIYGDGQEKEKLNLLIKQLNASKFIFLKGHTTDIHNIMSNATAFVLTSDFEGLSNSMLEALCIGIPCVCTDSPPGGARQFIKNGQNGYLVPIKNETKLIDAFKNIVEESASEKSKYLKYCTEIRKELSSEDICEKWEKICEGIINKND